jgi:hypothetical protein
MTDFCRGAGILRQRDSHQQDRAKELWETHGKPDNRDDEFWHTAERELSGLQDRGEDMKGSPDDAPTSS